MSFEQKPNPLFFVMLEYAKLKEEQLKRIELRDRMVDLNLAAVGVIGAWAFTHQQPPYSLLLIPWVCVVMGWSYLFNDDKVSALGEYFRRDMADRLGKNLGVPPEELFQWEVLHRSVPSRRFQKCLQFFVDQVTFVLSGIAAIVVLVYLAPPESAIMWATVGIEAAFLLMLSFFFWYLGDFAKGR